MNDVYYNNDLVFNNSFIKDNFYCTVHNIDLSILSENSFTIYLINKLKLNKLLAKYFIEYRKLIDQIVLEDLLIYQPISKTIDLEDYLYIMNKVVERILFYQFTLEGVWEVSELVDLNQIVDILDLYYQNWMEPIINKILYKNFSKELYIMNYSINYIDNNFYKPSKYINYNNVWSIENIHCKINNLLIRRNYLMLTIIKINQRKLYL